MTDHGTVGIVLVSHSHALAAGLAEMVAQIGAETVPIGAAGGTDDGRLGTSIAKLAAEIRRVDRGAGVLLLPDLGSSVLTAKTLLADTDTDTDTDGAADVNAHVMTMTAPIVIADAPFVEGAVAAAMAAASGADLKTVLAAAEAARDFRKL